MAPNFRHRLYGQYVTTHLSGHDCSWSLEQQYKCGGVYYLRKLLPTDKAAKILDLGCGSGVLLGYLKSQGYSDCSGIDISGEQVSLARQRGLRTVAQGELVAFLENTPDDFDCILAIDVLEHFKKQELLHIVDLVFQRLRAGGKLIFQSPNAASPFFGRIRYGDLTHEIAFTRHSVSQLLRSAGFIGIEVHPTGPRAHGLKSAIRTLLWFVISKLIAFCLLVENGGVGEILTQTLIGVGFKQRNA